MNKHFRAVGLAVLVLAVATMVSGGVAFADRPPMEPGRGPLGDEGGRMPSGPKGGDFGGPLGLKGVFGPGAGDRLTSQEDLQAATAEVLGMTVEELEEALDEKTLMEIARDQNVHMADIQDAVEAVRQDALQQAVEDGTLTQEQADLIAEKSGDRGFGLRGTDMLFGGFDKIQARVEATRAALAESLGMTVDQLEEALGEKSLVEIAKDQDVDMADVQEAMQAARQGMFEEALQQAVEDGKLTQEQADLVSAFVALRGDGPHGGLLGGDFGSFGRGMIGGPKGDRFFGPGRSKGGPGGDLSFGPGGMKDGPKGDRSSGPGGMKGGPEGGRSSGPGGMKGGPGDDRSFGPGGMRGGRPGGHDFPILGELFGSHK
jgi:hypothetical protein